jgi:hypothetical protein
MKKGGGHGLSVDDKEGAPEEAASNAHFQMMTTLRITGRSCQVSP